MGSLNIFSLLISFTITLFWVTNIRNLKTNENFTFQILKGQVLAIKKPHIWIQIVRSPFWQCFLLIVNIQDDISFRIVYYFFNPTVIKFINHWATQAVDNGFVLFLVGNFVVFVQHNTSGKSITVCYV